MTPAITEQELLERYAALAFDKQLNLYAVIGDRSWSVDMDAGTIAFGPDIVFPLQVLGTFSHASETWRWAWANEQANLPPLLLAQALQLQAWGQQHGVDLLTVGGFDATQADLHLIGAVATGMLTASGYYLANYGAGTMLLTVSSAQIDQQAPPDLARIPHAFTQTISQFELRHRPAFIHYVTQKGWTATEAADTVRATDGTATLVAGFDELGRLTSLKASSH